MRRAFDRVRDLACQPWTTPLILEGESGSGKTSIARILSQIGPRAGRPFVTLSCGSITPSLIETRLYGNVEGAYTDARKAADGVFKQAQGGVLFIDDFDKLPRDLQDRFLAAIDEDGHFTPVGGKEAIPVDVRIVIGTTVPLAELQRSGRLSPDLRWRLHSDTIHVPPARERVEDVLAIASSALARESSRVKGRRPSQFDEEALRLLATYSWPGNIRQVVATGRLAAHVNVAIVTAEHLRPLLDGLEAPMQRRTLASSTAAARLLAVRQELAIFQGDVDSAAISLEAHSATIFRILKQAQPEARSAEPQVTQLRLFDEAEQ